MTKEARMSNDEITAAPTGCFVIRHSDFIHHSSLVIRHSLCSLVVAGVLCACHKKPSPAADTTTSSASLASQPPVPTPAVQARAENNVRQSAEGEVDPFLTSELKKFVAKNHRLPQTFSEFASSQLDSVPRPPAGKKWVIDAASVQVKAAPSN
jgi:hypothetical protein